MPKTATKLTLVSSSQAAALLKVDVSTVSRLATTGELRTAVKAPGRRGARMFHLSDVEDLAVRRASAGATA